MNSQLQTNAPPVQTSQKPSWVRRWWTATRAFALPASTMSAIFGTVLAVTYGEARGNFPLFLAALVGMALLHTGANLLNDVYDFKRGIDRQVNPVSGSVVRGWITLREALFAGWVFMITGSLLGLYIFSQVGMPILWIGMAGVGIGVLYTWGPLPLKFNALGDLAVFLNFGILGSLGAWTVQTGGISWVPVIWAVPMSLLVVGILHANNWRDIRSDARGGIRTMAGLLGDTRSEGYYSFLLFAPFALIALFISDSSKRSLSLASTANQTSAMPDSVSRAANFKVTLWSGLTTIGLTRTGLAGGGAESNTISTFLVKSC